MNTFHELYKNSLTSRYHKEPYLTQDLQQHTFGMLLAALHFFPDVSIELVKAITAHDLAEGTYGDIPHDTKITFQIAKELDEAAHISFWSNRKSNLNPEDAKNSLTEAEVAILKFLDRFEVMCFLYNHPNRNYYKDMYSKAFDNVKQTVDTLYYNHRYIDRDVHASLSNFISYCTLREK